VSVVQALEGRRVLVVGASAGIGEAFAARAIREGAVVALTARRKERLEEIVAEAGGGVAIVADVSDPDDCARLGEEVRRELGEIDLVMYAAAMAPLKRFAETTAEEWRTVLATNVIGVHQVIAAVLPLMTPGGIIAVMSSETVGQPRSGLGAYSASKAALEESLRCWHNENPGIRFTCVAVGSTVPTEFGHTFDMELLMEMMNDWAMRGLAQSEFMSTDEVGEVLIGIFAAALPYPGVGLEHITVRSPSPVIGSADTMNAHAETTIPAD
jgi:NAD(P)-dependent dehydrogenase (short-subunit alcohol dehydrogenase family)